MACISRIIRLTPIKNTISNCTRLLSTQKLNNVTPILPQIALLNNHWIYKENDKIQIPTVIKKIELPNGLIWIPPKIDPVGSETMEAPSAVNSDVSKEAARLIIIRRKKMKKHKLKKLRKRMKFEWAKIRQKRELRKEKAFQAVLIQQCKDAEAFSAEKYVEERLDKLNELVIPRFWKGKRLPEFIIRQKMGLPPK